MDGRSIDFLIDTGAEVSLLRKDCAQRSYLEPTNVKLTSVDGQPITTLGRVRATLRWKSLRRNFSWSFVVADVPRNIIGIDFLSHYDFVVDCSSKQLVDSTTKLMVGCETVHHPGLFSVRTVSPIKDLPSDIRELLERFPAVTSELLHQKTLGSVHSTTHHIDTGDARPISQRARRLSPEKSKVVKEVLEQWLEDGTIRPSNSAWSSPLHVVPKSTPGEWRVVCDYRRLNAVTKPDNYAPPDVQSFTRFLHGCTVFTKLDLRCAYQQIPMAKEDIPKTAVSTEHGNFEFVYMPFGLKNSAASFQRHMDTVLRGAEFCFCYIDDILIASTDFSKHLEHLREVLSRLDAAGLCISLRKCVFFAPEIDFLGYQVNADGILPPRSRVEALRSMTEPKDYKSLRRFLGMVGYFRRFIPRFAEIVVPLQDLVTRTQPNKQGSSIAFEWLPEHREAFASLLAALSDAVLLHHPSPHCHHYSITSDASGTAIAASLHEMPSGRPLSFFSRKLTEAERRLSTYDRELLAAYSAVCHFRGMIEGRTVTLFSDHKPLVAAFYKKGAIVSPRQERHLSFLAEFVHDCQHIAGAENVVADQLSRSLSAVEVDPFDLDTLAKSQANDSELEDLKSSTSTSLQFVSFPLASGSLLYCDVSTPYPRPFVPLHHRRQVFDDYHHLSHAGTKAMIRILKERYVWPRMADDVKEWCRTCQSCQASKVIRHTRSQLAPFPSFGRFECVHMDIAEMKVSANDSFGRRYIVTFIDRTTKWIELEPVANITAEVVARALVNTWVSRFGVPLYLVTDRGSQFESELFACLSRLVGFYRIRTTSYHPQSNGAIERIHKTLKTSVKAVGKNWLDALPVILLGLRCIPSESTGQSPFTMVTGTAICVPTASLQPGVSSQKNCDFVSTLAKHLRELSFCQPTDYKIPHEKGYIPKALESCDEVWVRIDRIRRPLEAPYQGPYSVVERHPKYFVVRLPDSTTKTVAIDRLKPCVKPVNQRKLPLMSKEPSPQSPREVTTRYGRRVRFRFP